MATASGKVRSQPGDRLYHLAAWAFVLADLAFLDFLERRNDLLFSLNWGERITNFVPLLILLWPLALLLGWMSARLEAGGWPRLAKFAVVFAFLTVNVWSFKTGATAYITTFAIVKRRWAARGILLAVALLSALLARKPGHFAPIEEGKRWILKILAGLSALTLLGFAFFEPVHVARESDKPNLIVITFDAMSANHMSLYGYQRETTPNLDRLAQQSWVFDNFLANYNSTPAGIPAIDGRLTQLLNGKLTTTTPGLIDRLPFAGYDRRAHFGFYGPQAFLQRDFFSYSITRSGKTSPLYKAFATFFPERSLFWLAGLTTDDYWYYWPYTEDCNDEAYWLESHYPGEQSLRSALDYINEHPRGGLIWIHLWEPHYPYWPPPDLRGKFGPSPEVPKDFINGHYPPAMQPWAEGMRNRYDENVLYADRLVGGFIDELKKRGQFDSSYLVITSDHGESTDNGYIGHTGDAVLESIIRIPLIIHAPGQTQPLRVKTMASQIDLAPTLLQLLGVPDTSMLQGESLLPYLADPQKKKQRPHFAVSISALTGTKGDIAIYQDSYKVVYSSLDHKNVKLFDLATDPRAEKDLAAEKPELTHDIMRRAGVE